ncbi:hypothetical protein [Methylophaga sp.]|jgi:hypothetical protein|uniref:hypothetical protein n=1 Tax=Methylophaga sp. TaxID=2024840 RepID=UPI000C4E8C70|nr:hypothetical protein [Methylophaga sp.]MBP24311.1 hypothetical protein [Methylophaga sp.]|tara:strand:+ start:323 stop:700 length:378 start_codon:yes stop_codon:yes gene_type:complete
MADLFNKTPANTYQSLLQVGNELNQIMDSVLRPVEDGRGNESAISLSTAGLGLKGPLLTDSITEFVLKGTGSTTGDIFSIRYLLDANKLFSVDYVGTVKLATQESEPDSVTGGFYFDGSEYYLNK